MSSLFRTTWLLAAVLAIGLAVRLVANDADPPLDFGAAHLTDEGYYLKNGKEWLLRGRWVPDDDNHNHIFLAPLTVVAYTAGMALGGIDLSSARAVSGVLAMVALGLAFTPLRRQFGSRAALFALALCAIDPALVALGRVALAEGVALVPTLFLVIALSDALDGNRRWWPVCVWLAVALFVKASAVLLLGVVGCAILLDAIARRELRYDWRRRVATIAALGAVVVAWRIGWIMPRPGAKFMFDYELGAHVSLSLLAPFHELLRSLTTKHAFGGFATDPLLAGLAAVALAVVGVEVVRGRRPPGLDLAAAAWLAGTALFFSAMPYQPPRYFLVLGAPAALLVARLLADPVTWWARGRAVLPGFPIVFLCVCATSASLALVTAGISTKLAAFAIALLATLLCGFTLARGAGAMTLCLVLIAPTMTLFRWAQQRTDSIRAASAAITQQLRPGDAVAGYFAPTFILASPARSYVVHGPWNPGNLEERGINWLLVRAEELRWLQDRDPTLAPRLAEVATFAPQAGVRGSLVMYQVTPTKQH